VVLDRHVLAFDKTGLAETIAERGGALGCHFARAAIDESDDRQRRLLRVRYERP
jgi:hypothetical protein